jgi:hypothetical protein
MGLSRKPGVDFTELRPSFDVILNVNAFKI